jgi:hypothetical protein
MLYPVYVYPRATRKKREWLHAQFEKQRSANTPPSIKLFSNQDEDGIILWLAARIGCKQGFFVDIGSNDCVNSNCANLALNFNWSGVFVDAELPLLQIGRRLYSRYGLSGSLKFVHQFVSEENIDDLLKSWAPADVDFMNIDIDGNDYAIWKSIHSIRPKIVVAENRIEFGREALVVPVDKGFDPKYWGASIVSMTELATEKGYTLVATNFGGFNGFYLRNDLFATSGLKPLPLEHVWAKLEKRIALYGKEEIEKIRSSNLI